MPFHLQTCQTVQNLLSTHGLGTPGQQYRLKRSIMRYNWNNLPFDLRETSPLTTDQPPGAEQEQEQENLDIYLQDQVEECGECEAVKQVSSKLSIQYFLKSSIQESRKLKVKIAELGQVRVLKLCQAQGK